jgi:hypothetical protein
MRLLPLFKQRASTQISFVWVSVHWRVTPVPNMSRTARLWIENAEQRDVEFQFGTFEELQSQLSFLHPTGHRPAPAAAPGLEEATI